MMKKTVGMAGMVLALAVGAHAAIIEGDAIAIDFGATAPAVANWNQISTSTLSIADLKRLSDGNLTGVGVTVTLTSPNGDYIKNAAPSAGLGSTDASIYDDHLAANSTGASGVNDLITVTYTGLDDSLSYTLTGGMARILGPAGFEQTYTVGGIAYDYTDSSGVDAYAEYTGLSSSGGVLTFTVSDYTDSDLASISQMTLTAVPPPGSPSLELAPTSISLDLIAPDATVEDIITASYIAGASSSSDIEILTYTADAGFSAAITNTTLGLSNTEEDITVTFDNAGIGLANGESTNSTLVVTWSEIGVSTVTTSSIPLDVTYINVPSSLELNPDSISLTLLNPDTSANATMVASFVEGTLSSDVEVLSITSTNGNFSVDDETFILDTVVTSWDVTVTYTNTGTLVNTGDTDASTLVIAWTEDGSGVINTSEVPVDVNYVKGDVVDVTVGATYFEVSASDKRIATTVIRFGANNGETFSYVGLMMFDLSAYTLEELQSSAYALQFELGVQDNTPPPADLTIEYVGTFASTNLGVAGVNGANANATNIANSATVYSIFSGAETAGAKSYDATVIQGDSFDNQYAVFRLTKTFEPNQWDIPIGTATLIVSTTQVEIGDVTMGISGSDVVLSWEGDFTCDVETNANLVHPNWGVLESDATSPATNAISSEAQLFYRLSK
ncbi:hypothetical protein P4B35_18235 [Pontiellaceae bacterium B12227]|nr:hypothetical protein [Pontiellaceae bacterium B12227]